MPYLSKLTKRLALAGATTLLLVACGVPDAATAVAGPEEPGTPGAAVSVRLTPESLAVRVGVIRRLTVDQRDRNGRQTSESITWTSSDTSIARVDSTGTVLTLSEGTAEIRGTTRGGGNGRARLSVTVEPVATVSLNPSSVALTVGQSAQLSAITLSASDSVLTGRRVTWSSTATAIATVDTLGVVTARAAGTARVIADVSGVRDTTTVTVAEPAPLLPGTVDDLAVVSVTDTTATLFFTEVTDGTGAPANYEVRYAAGSLTWDAATPVARGTCASPVAGTSVGAGRSCTVRGLAAATLHRFQVRAFRGSLGSSAVYGSTSNIASGTTNQATVASVTLTPTSGTITVGQTATFAATARDAQGNVLTGRTVTWASSATAVATVSSSGVATGVAAGSASIRATVGGVTGSAALTVTAPAPAPVATITLSPATASATVGGTATFAATLRDSAGTVLTGRTVTWSSSNTAVATVSSSGVATAVTAGTASIRATSGGVTGSATLTVTAPAPAAVASVTVAPSAVSLEVGRTQAFSVTLRDAQGNLLTGRTVTWSSSNTAVATVTSAGVASALVAGSASIRATAEGVTGQAALTVTSGSDVTPVPTVFASEWANARGNTHAAWSDGGRFDRTACSSATEVLSVIPGTDVGFTETSNVLRVQMRGEQCGTIQRQNALPQSTSHWGRFYIRNDEFGSRNDHTMAYNNIHDGMGMQAVPFSRWANSYNPVTRGTLVQGQWMASVIIRFVYPYGRWYSPVLQAGTWYRYEYQMEYVTATTYRIWPRIYDMAGNLLYDADDFRNEDGRSTLAGYYDIGGANRAAPLGVLNTETSNASVADNFGLGNEGPSGSPNTLGYWYYAKLGLSTTGWLGR